MSVHLACAEIYIRAAKRELAAAIRIKDRGRLAAAADLLRNALEELDLLMGGAA
jgi:hypothetical protein